MGNIYMCFVTRMLEKDVRNIGSTVRRTCMPILKGLYVKQTPVHPGANEQQ